MSDQIKHECGIALIRLLKPLEFYQKKYGSKSYGANKMYLMMEKQHNRGQDGAGLATVKMDAKPGEKYIFRERSSAKQPIQEVFTRVNERMASSNKTNGNVPFQAELLLGHVRYGTFGKNNLESVHPFLRQNNWTHRNLIVAGNFNMTNNQELFDNLVKLGQHPKSKVDSVTVMEKIGHFLDDAVRKIYKDLKKEGFNKQEASPLIEKRLKISKVLKKASKDWDGGYAMAGLLGHGDAFVLRDPSAIRPAYYFKNDEVVVVASERPVIQTVFNTAFDEIKELEAGHSIIIKKSGKTSIVPILEKRERKACSFERIYFSRGSDKEIYLERKKLGELLFPKILNAINGDLKNTVFSYIPNTAETSFFGLVQEAQKYISSQAIVKLLEEKQEISKENLEKLFSLKPRIEKVAIKDAKLRTFIADDANRDELVAHVYDITYGSIKQTDTLVIIDDSIVRGTTLQKSILKILDRLNPKKILVVSSAPQIKYPDCYGIDMAKMEDFIAFRAAISLLKSEGKENIIKETYKDCLEELKLPSLKMKNKVSKIYSSYTDEDISNEISKILKEKEIKTKVQVIFQTVKSLHSACPKNLGDWYFTGDYPTPGGNKVVNQSFVNYFEGTKKRAY
ncbi:amidophosphoribosyltransferase [Flavobacteriaceae bacterium]|nr:amidophosphoribosyltransferase [Flavobacteriaceae bacterium]MDB0043240.1 amidophosphoribosyltransferase [Flavobacteriaceae bacterium]MDB4050199.1 amidophosphoribosyltransferase [Flavobacteriaceae bacterium]MDB4239351.1 amidophosphoribosyltransferase [Flavobacteriaceae bacterium]MDB9787739.1 amidophosphoribosyltransferase [Flavobacteriaceae bacterium]